MGIENETDQTDEKEDRGDELPEEPKAEGAPSDEAKPDEDEETEGKEPEGKADAEDEEDDEDEEEEEEGKGKKKPVLIPKSRYDSKAREAKRERERREQLEIELAAARAEREKADGRPTTQSELDAKLDELEDKIEEARADNKMDEVKKLRAAARRLQNDFIQRQLAEVHQASTAAALETARLDAMIDLVEEHIPELRADEDNEEYDQDKVDEVQDLRSAFEAKGYTRLDALKKAVNYVFPGRLGGSTTTEAPPAKEKPKKSTDPKKKLDAASRTAPDMTKHGKGSDSTGLTTDMPDINKIGTDEEFEALPEAMIRRMRGDYL